MDRNRRSAAAIKATQGPVAALQTEYKGLQREIQRLIRNGIDPQDDALKPLVQRYKQLDNEMEQVQAQSKKTGKSFTVLDGLIVGLGAQLVNLGQQGFRKLVEFMGDSIEAASRLEEVNSKFAVTFGEVSAQAENAAESLQESYGLSIRESKELLSNTGDLLTGFGLASAEALDLSESTNKLAVDLASFSNAQGGAEAVARALTSAYTGEREALKTYGIVINEAMVQAEMLAQAQQGLTYETEQQAKIHATLALATEQSKNAIGDFARTQDSAANQSRQLTSNMDDLQAALGNNLLPTVAKLTKMLNEGLDQGIENLNAMSKLRDLQEPVKENATALERLQHAYTQFGQRIRGIVDIDRTRLSLTENIQATEAEIANLKRQYANTRVAQEAAKVLGIETKVAAALEDREKLLVELKERQDKITEAVGQEEMLHELINEKLAMRRGEEPEEPEETPEERAEREKKAAESYGEARKHIVSILEAESDEYDQIQEQIDYLNRYPWSPGELEEDRLAALEALREKQDELIEQQAELGAENSWAEYADAVKAFGLRADDSLKEVKEGSDDAGESAEEMIQRFVNGFQEAAQHATSFLDALGDLVSATSEKEIASIEAVYDARIEAIDAQIEAVEAEHEAYTAMFEDLENQYAGMAEIYTMLGDAETAATYKKLADQQGLIEDFTQFTAEQRAQMLEDAKAAENEEVVAAIEAANERVKAEEEAAKKTEQLEKEKAAAKAKREREIAQAEYRSAMAQWSFNLATAIAETAVSVAKSIAGSPLTFGLPWSAANAAAGAVEIAAVAAAKPEPPSFQTGTGPSGFVVPESASTRGDSQLFRANPGERVDVTPRGGAAVSQRITFQLGEDVLIDWINDKIDSGEIRAGVNV
jgi:hypothetical protein